MKTAKMSDQTSNAVDLSGVGRMTVAALMINTLNAYQSNLNLA